MHLYKSDYLKPIMLQTPISLKPIMLHEDLLFEVETSWAKLLSKFQYWWSE